MRVNQNIAAYNAYRNLSASQTTMSKTLEKLSSSTRINRAGDDAAGLTISQGLRAQVGGLRQATRNAQDGISVVQTAEGALSEIHNMLGRMRDLAVQAANSGSNDTNAVTAANTEVQALLTEITRVSDKTKFGGMSLLDGSYGVRGAQATGMNAANSYTWAAGDGFAININGTGATTVALTAVTAANGAQAASVLQNNIRAALAASGTAGVRAFADKVTVTSTSVGAGSSLTIKVEGLTDGQTFTLADGTNTPLALAAGKIGSGTTVSAAAGTGGVFQVGANANDTISVSIGDMDATALGVNVVDLTSATGPTVALGLIDTAISTVSTTRSGLGALQNRFESVIANLQVTTENLSSSESRIRDTDYALEMVSFTRGQIMNQVGTAMLGQANQLPQGVLQLLRG
jgi:flagellin